jgi:hypothetical protein
MLKSLVYHSTLKFDAWDQVSINVITDYIKKFPITNVSDIIIQRLQEIYHSSDDVVMEIRESQDHSLTATSIMNDMLPSTLPNNTLFGFARTISLTSSADNTKENNVTNQVEVEPLHNRNINSSEIYYSNEEYGEHSMCLDGVDAHISYVFEDEFDSEFQIELSQLELQFLVALRYYYYKYFMTT